uniref:Kazal-like domain-containing protein n=1 Tax=Timema cristinae TaxID=61476 RepID=A0A7R9GZ95_TIMCR|nr:unnamed protein product [Timema cristinae]
MQSSRGLGHHGSEGYQLCTVLVMSVAMIDWQLCADLKDFDFEYHPCSAINPCENNPCGEGKTCHLARKVCLSLLKNIPCRQYECVDNSVSCSSTAHGPVCDTEGKEHPNMCYLVRYGKTLAYRGPCLAVPQCGDVIVCPPLLRPGCLGVTPPGACCPICGGALRFLYSQKQVDRALYILRGNTLSALTVHAVLTALERQVQVAECAVRGYLTVETDLFVLVQPVGSTRPPSDVQLEACIREAEKLANLVRGSSPRVLSELSLSALTTATESKKKPLIDKTNEKAYHTQHTPSTCLPDRNALSTCLPADVQAPSCSMAIGASSSSVYPSCPSTAHIAKIMTSVICYLKSLVK